MTRQPHKPHRAGGSRLRSHCLRQLHGALVVCVEEMRAITVAEAGAPIVLTRGGPIWKLRWRWCAGTRSCSTPTSGARTWAFSVYSRWD